MASEYVNYIVNYKVDYDVKYKNKKKALYKVLQSYRRICKNGIKLTTNAIACSIILHHQLMLLHCKWVNADCILGPVRQPDVSFAQENVRSVYALLNMRNRFVYAIKQLCSFSPELDATHIS